MIKNTLPTDVGNRYSVMLDSPIVLQDTAVMVTADWHIPLYSPELVNLMLHDAKKQKINTLIIAGDFFNFDALSTYFPKQDSAKLTFEYEEGLAVMSCLLAHFKDIVYLWGNHDFRLCKALGHAMHFSDAMRLVFGALGEKLVDKIRFSNLDHVWCNYNNNKDRFRICHPNSYNRVPLSSARTLCTKYNSHSITAHSHHCAVGFSTDGLLIAAELGGLFDVSKTEYLQRSSTNPVWQQGYGWIAENGLFTLKSPKWSAGAV